MTDYQTVSRGLYNLSRNCVKLIYVEHSFDLGEDSSEEAKVAASHSDQLCDDLWEELLIWEFNSDRGPALLQELLHLDRVESAEFVNETNSGEELRESSYALLDSRHADQDHPCVALIKDRPHLLKTVHLQPVSFVDDDECRWVRNCFLSRFI